MKKTASFLLCLVILLSLTFSSFAVSEANNYITSSPTPTGKVQLKYAKRFGTGYANAPSVPLVVGDTLVVAAGSKLYKLNAQNGNIISSSDLCAAVVYSTVSPLYAEGKVFVQLLGGIIQAFDYDSMKSLWIYSDPLGGQALCPLTYDGENVYTGFWNGEEKTASYVCVSAKDENKNSQTESKTAKWTYESGGGFYWAGCAVNDDFVIFGCDNGKSDETSKSKIVSLNKNTGKLMSSLSVQGDVRSSISYCQNTDTYYAASKAGYVYRFTCDKTGKLSLVKSVKLCSSITASAVINGGRLYIGGQNGGTGEFYVLSADSLKKIYSCKMNGYPQASVLVSNANKSKTYIYLTYNAKPGGITMFTDSVGQTSAEKTEIFVPDAKYDQYGVCPVVCDSEGTLYFKNDSCAIMALCQKEESEFTQFEGLKNLWSRFILFLKRLLNR